MNNNNNKPLLTEEQISVVENWVNGNEHFIKDRKSNVILDTTNASVTLFEFQDFGDK